MTGQRQIRAVQRADYPLWRKLWEGYNRFYGRSGATALAEEITLSARGGTRAGHCQCPHRGRVRARALGRRAQRLLADAREQPRRHASV